MIKVNDVITFSEDNKVVVLDVIQYENEVYAFVNRVTPDESDVTDEYFVMRYNQDRNTMAKVKDKVLLEKVGPIFGKRIETLINNVLKASGMEEE